MTQANLKRVGVFVLLPAPLNPIGAFDAETFKANFRSVVESSSDIRFVAVNLSGLEFVYSDAYNAFMQFHQELSGRNGAFAVLANNESLVKSLRKLGLERFIRIFTSPQDMAVYVPIRLHQPAKNIPKVDRTVAQEPKPSAPIAEEPKKTVAEPVAMDKNPLVDEASSSKGTVVAVIVLLLLTIAAVSYLLL